jgi:hypothetical protein
MFLYITFTKNYSTRCLSVAIKNLVFIFSQLTQIRKSMPKISQALRDSITDQQWNKLFQDEKKLSELLEYCNSAKLKPLEKRMFEVINSFYCTLVVCYSNANPPLQGQWKKCEVNPETGRKQGFFSANFEL